MSYNPGQQPGWPTSPPPVEPPRKRRRWPWWVGGGVVALIVVAAIAGGGNSGGNAPTAGTTTSPVTASLTPGDPGSPAGQIAATTSVAPAQDTIVYTITGGHASDITWIAPNLQESQITDRTALPWSKTFTAPSGSSGLGMSLDAQNAGGGTIGCSISVNGRVVVSNSSSGQYAIVTCTDTGSN